MIRRWLQNFSFQDLDRRMVGVVALAVLGIAVIGAFSIGRTGLLHDRYPATAVFTETGGIDRGAPVRVAGVQVGAVTGVTPDFDLGQVVVSFEVDRDVDLADATTASIEPGTLLGGVHLVLDTPSPVGDDTLAEMPEDERRIPIGRTEVTRNLLDVLDTTTRSVEQLDTDLVDQAMTRVADLAAGTSGDIGELLTHLGTVAQAVNDREQDLRRLIGNSRRVTATLASRDEELVRLIDATDVLLDRVVERRNELRTLLGDGHAVVQHLTTLIRDHRAGLDALLDDLHVTLGVVDRRMPELNRSLAWLGPTFDTVTAATEQGPWIDLVLYQVRPIPPVD